MPQTPVIVAVFAVDHPVVVAEGQVHHGSDFHFAIDGHRALNDIMHSKNARLGRIQNGG